MDNSDMDVSGGFSLVSSQPQVRHFAHTIRRLILNLVSCPFPLLVDAYVVSLQSLLPTNPRGLPLPVEPYPSTPIVLHFVRVLRTYR